MNAKSHLETLPKKCIEHILLFAEVEDQVRLTQTSKTLHKILRENTSLLGQAYKKMHHDFKTDFQARGKWYLRLDTLEEIKIWFFIEQRYDSKFYDYDLDADTYLEIATKDFSRLAQKSLRHAQWMLTHRHHNYYPYFNTKKSLAYDLAKKDIRFLDEYLRRPKWRNILQSNHITTPIAKLSTEHCRLIMRYYPAKSGGTPDIFNGKSHFERLPKNCIEHILLFAEVEDQVRLTRTSKIFHKILRENTALLAQAYKKLKANEKSSRPWKTANWYNGFDSLEEIKVYCLLHPRHDSMFYDFDSRENTYEEISAKNFSREAQKSLRHTQWILTHRHHNYYPYTYAEESLALDLAKKDIHFLEEYLRRPQWREMLRSDFTTTPIAKLSTKHCQLMMQYFPIESEGAQDVIELFSHSEQHKTLLTNNVDYLGPKGLINVYRSTLRNLVKSDVKKKQQFIESILVHYLKNTMLACITKASNQALPSTLFNWPLLLNTMKGRKEKSFQTAYTFLASLGKPIFFSSKGGMLLYPFKDTYLQLPQAATQLMTKALSAARLELPQHHWAKAKLQTYRTNLPNLPIDVLKIIVQYGHLQDLTQLNYTCKKLSTTIQPYLNKQKSLVTTINKANPSAYELLEACKTSPLLTEAFLRSEKASGLTTSNALELANHSKTHASLILRSKLLQHKPKNTKKLEPPSSPTKDSDMSYKISRSEFQSFTEMMGEFSYSFFDRQRFLDKAINRALHLPLLIKHAWHCFGGYQLMEIAKISPELAKQILFHPQARERLKHGHLMGITKASKEHADLGFKYFPWTVGAKGLLDILQGNSSSPAWKIAAKQLALPWMRIINSMNDQTLSQIEKSLSNASYKACEPFDNPLPFAKILQFLINGFQKALVKMPESKKKVLSKRLRGCQTYINLYLSMVKSDKMHRFNNRNKHVDLGLVLLAMIREVEAKRKQKKSGDK